MIRLRSLPLLAAVALLAIAAGRSADAAPKAAAASPSPSSSPAPAPTATPEALDHAIPRLQARVTADPTDKVAATELASDFLQINRPDLALPLTERLIQQGVKTAQVFYFDGAANANLGHIPQAITDFEQASNYDPTNMTVLQSLTSIYLRTNRPTDAERVAKRALTFNKDSKDAYENYGYVLDAQKKYDEARQQFESAAKLDPKDAHPVVLEARTYQEQTAVALAAQLYDRAIAIDPNSLEALIGKAQVASGQHDTKTAVATYETILKLQTSPADQAAVIDEEGKTYAAEKMDTDAVTQFQRAIALYPAVPQTHVVYGDYFASKNDRAGAEREWTLGLGPNRDVTDSLARLGELYSQAGNNTKAIEMYKRLAEVAGNSGQAYVLLGGAYARNKNFQQAHDSFRAAYALQKTPDALLGMAGSDMQTNSFKEAVAIYEALDKNAPQIVKQNPVLLFTLAKAYQGLNQPAKARATFVRFLTYLKPGTQNYKEVQGYIAAIDKASKPKTTAHK